MRKQIQDFFTYTSGEKAGIFVLVVIISSLLAMLFLVDEINQLFLPSREEVELLKTEFEKDLDALILADSLSKIEAVNHYSTDDSFPNQVADLTPFNPNKFSLEIGEMIGLSERQSESILKYINKGGQFKIKEDFKKMYVISTEKYDELKEYIQLPVKYKSNYEKKEWEKEEAAFEKKPKAIITANLNEADSADLVKVSGIGPFYAKSIVKYRDELGGFVNKRQLLELYGMDEERYLKLASVLLLDNPEPYRMINVNTISIEELKNHPYFDWNLSRYLVNYRENHGKFKSVQDLKELRLIDTDLYRKIAPYITL
jgi:competence protein ComEA